MNRLIDLTRSDRCKDCIVCCRFPEESPNLKPKGRSLKKTGEHFTCEAYDPETRRCAAYARRPFDCEIYPFAVAKSEDGACSLLVIDSLCPNYAEILSKLSDIDLSGLKIPEHAGIEWEESFIPLKVLEAKEGGSGTLNALTPDAGFFFRSHFFNSGRLSACGFPYHMMWTGITAHFWKIIDGSFCLFSRTGKDYSMPLPPMPYSTKACRECSRLLAGLNSGSGLSIFNASAETAETAAKDGLTTGAVSEEFLYKRTSLAELKGDNYKGARWLCNVFEKNKDISFGEYKTEYLENCAAVLNSWYNNKFERTKYENDLHLLKHALKANRTALSIPEKLGLTGRVLRCGMEIAAYTFGAALTEDTFCVYFEIANPAFKGAAQYIFRELCRELIACKYVNTMGCDGVEGLKTAKELYKPVEKLGVYTITI